MYVVVCYFMIFGVWLQVRTLYLHIQFRSIQTPRHVRIALATFLISLTGPT